MLSLKIIDVKAFMNHLLLQNVFDNFFVCEAEFKTFGQFYINGKLNEDYYSTDEKEILEGRQYATWNEMKPFAYSLVKGNKLPVAIKIVMRLSDKNTQNILMKSGLAFTVEEISGLFLNIRYEKGMITLTTGVSFKTFTMDKSLEQVWDNNLRAFLKHHEIPVEDMI